MKRQNFKVNYDSKYYEYVKYTIRDQQLCGQSQRVKNFLLETEV